MGRDNLGYVGELNRGKKHGLERMEYVNMLEI
jgi:hypothetical protein